MQSIRRKENRTCRASGEQKKSPWRAASGTSRGGHRGTWIEAIKVRVLCTGTGARGEHKVRRERKQRAGGGKKRTQQHLRTRTGAWRRAWPGLAGVAGNAAGAEGGHSLRTDGHTHTNTSDKNTKRGAGEKKEKKRVTSKKKRRTRSCCC